MPRNFCDHWGRQSLSFQHAEQALQLLGRCCTCTGSWKFFKLIHITVIICLIVFPLTFISGFCIVPFVSLNKDEDKFSRVETVQQEMQAVCTWCGEMIYCPVWWQEMVCRKKMPKKIISTSIFICFFFFCCVHLHSVSCYERCAALPACKHWTKIPVSFY